MIKNEFIETIKEFKMLRPNDKVVVGVSGGADSIALMHLLHDIKNEFNLSLHIAHLNHMLRRGEAEVDMRFVQGLAHNLKLPITVESFDVGAYAAQEKLGIEEAARKVRYDFFERVAGQFKADKIAVGHNADDNVETFLMRLLRGSGIKGLCGIPPTRGKIIRPLIKLWRKDIEGYINLLKLVPRLDHTNYESKYMRNRVRLKLIPQLKVYNLNIKEIIHQTILLLTEDASYLELKAEGLLSQAIVSFEENQLRLDLKKLREIEPAILNHCLRRGIEKVKGNLLGLSYCHIQDILDKLNKDSGWELHLPDGIFVFGEGGELVISPDKPQKTKRKKYFQAFSIPGEVKIEQIDKIIKVSFVDKVEKFDDANIAFVDGSKMLANVIVRSRETGDRFVPYGLKGSKKLQDFLVDAKVPLDERDSVPIVESGGRIIWVAGLRVDDRAKVTEKTKKIVKLELI